MSFDINFNKNLSNVQASSKTSDGGAGNTGYFQREEEKENNLLGFAKDYPNDSFEKIEITEDEQEQSLLEIILDLFSSIVKFFQELFGKFIKK